MPTNTPPPTADLVALVREIAAYSDMHLREEGELEVYCRFCQGDATFDYAAVEYVFAHKPGCIYVRACEIVARLDA